MLRQRSILTGAIIIAFVTGFWLGKYFFEPTEMSIPSEHFERMSLLTWKGWSGDLCFLLIPRLEEGRARHDFWSKWHGQCGLAGLKTALAAVPRGKHVDWHNSPPKFELPSEKFCDEMVHFAKTAGVDLHADPALDTWFSDWEPQ